MSGGRDRLRTGGAARLLGGAALAGLVALGAGAAAQPGAPAAKAAPQYLSYAEFGADDPPGTVALKRAYNEAVQRYNQSLYDYHVTLERHDQLVDLHNRSTDPAEKRKTRDEAAALRGRLATLGRDVRTRAGLVDEAARRAAAGGVTLTR